MRLPDRLLELAMGPCLAALCIITSIAAAGGYEIDVYSQEELEYDLRWWILGAGEVRLELDSHASLDGRSAFHVTYLVKSSGLAGRFFKVDDRIDSYVDPSTRCSLRIDKRLQEGKTVQDHRVDFDYATGKALTTRYGQDPVSGARRLAEHQEDAVGGCVQDILSALYAIRSHSPLAVGTSFAVPTFDRGELYDMSVNVLKRETVSIGLGRYDAWVVEPQAQFGGAFHKKGRLRIWIEDGPSRLPLIIKTDLAVGSLKAELKRFTRTMRSK